MDETPAEDCVFKIEPYLTSLPKDEDRVEVLWLLKDIFCSHCGRVYEEGDEPCTCSNDE